ncbi:Acyl-CoA Delta(11) desaturase [Blattella germanica]|nr:Acyl-CoA Delta(11) desaturase [Blattella germanica]
MEFSTTTVTKTIEKEILEDKTEDKRVFTQPMKWINVFLISLLHFLALYCAYYCLFIHGISTKTVIFQFLYGYIGGLGVTCGAHRLWTHRAYKATVPLRIILITGYISTGMNSLFQWVRDHRVHHRFSETDADPHNANRGLFFSHVGWLFQRKHPEVRRRGQEVDMSDISADPVVLFQEKYFMILQPTLAVLVPTVIPVYFWGELWELAFLSTMFRWASILNVVWSVNSFAHIYGYRPYNQKIMPAENFFVSMFALGEGWHNYHHTFPWDYKTSELPYYMNLSTLLIDFFAYIGWAYDLKQSSKSAIENKAATLGDGTYYERMKASKRHS